MDNAKEISDEKREWAYAFSRDKGERDYFAFLSQARSEGYAEGFAQGLAIAREEKRELAARLFLDKLQQQFGQVDRAHKDLILGASADQLEFWAKYCHFLGVLSIDDLLTSY